VRSVGIIANPAAGKDIRRLVAYGSSIDNHEKVNLVSRILLGLDAMGVELVHLMPDTFSIGLRALERLDGRISLEPHLLEMEVEGTAQDSELAASLMVREGVACIVTLGGDGTNRAVAKGCGRVPLIAISSGTNNIFPSFIEGTIAGMAAGVAASGMVPLPEYIVPHPRLLVRKGGMVVDMALVDVVVTNDLFPGTKAVWEVSHITEIFTCRARPDMVGLSAIPGCLHSLPQEPTGGLHLVLGEAGRGTKVLAPIAPGLIRPVWIAEWTQLQAGRKVRVSHYPSTLALDGEREIYAGGEESLEVELSFDGPFLLDHEGILRHAARMGLFERGVRAQGRHFDDRPRPRAPALS